MQELSVHEVEQVGGGVPMMFSSGLTLVGVLSASVGVGGAYTFPQPPIVYPGDEEI